MSKQEKALYLQLITILFQLQEYTKEAAEKSYEVLLTAHSEECKALLRAVNAFEKENKE